MKSAVITREQLLAAAMQLAQEKGIASLNIRALAEKSGVSVGSIYNYFPHKNALVLALLEGFWREAAHHVPKMSEEKDFRKLLLCLYERFYLSLASFKATWLSSGDSMLNEGVRALGKEMENEYFSHIIAGLDGALQRDTLVRQNAFGDGFTRRDFAVFVWNNMFLTLKRGDKDCNFLMEIINKCIY